MTRGGTAYVRLHIVHADFSAPSGDATRGRSLVSLIRLGVVFHIARGSGDRFCTMPLTKSSLFNIVLAPLVAAMFFTHCIVGFGYLYDRRGRLLWGDNEHASVCFAHSMVTVRFAEREEIL